MHNIFRQALVLIVALCLSNPQGPFDIIGQAIADVTGIHTDVLGGNVSFGPPQPEKIPQMLQSLPQTAAQFFLNPMAGPLASAIHQGRDRARNGNCDPAPDTVVEVISRFMPPSVFDGVCWTEERTGLTLDSFAINDGQMAITLEDTIVFKDSNAASMPDLWAHELIHVCQFRRLGLPTFASLYSTNWKSLENEAYAFQDFVASRMNVSQSAPGWQPQYYTATPSWDPNAGIADQEYVQQARHTINPLNCSHIERVNNFAQIFNNCPIAFRVVSFDATNLQTGQNFSFSCQGNACVVRPGTFSSFPDIPGSTSFYAHMMW